MIATPVLPLLGTVFASILEVFFLCLAGYILAWNRILTRPIQKALNRLNISLFTPTLVFSKVAFFLTPEKLVELWIIPLLFVVVTAVSMAIAYVLAKVFRLRRSQKNFALAASMFMNSNSLPIALMQSLVASVPALRRSSDDEPDAMLARALMYLVVFSTLGLLLRWSYGVHLLAQADVAPTDEVNDGGTDACTEIERDVEGGEVYDTLLGDHEQAAGEQVEDGWSSCNSECSCSCDGDQDDYKGRYVDRISRDENGRTRNDHDDEPEPTIVASSSASNASLVGYVSGYASTSGQGSGSTLTANGAVASGETDTDEGGDDQEDRDGDEDIFPRTIHPNIHASIGKRAYRNASVRTITHGNSIAKSSSHPRTSLNSIHHTFLDTHIRPNLRARIRRRPLTEPTSTRFQSVLRQTKTRISNFFFQCYCLPSSFSFPRSQNTSSDATTILKSILSLLARIPNLPPPLLASLFALLTALIPPLQRALGSTPVQPLRAAMSAAAGCAVPVTLIVLGGYFFGGEDGEDKKSAKSGREETDSEQVNWHGPKVFGDMEVDEGESEEGEVNRDAGADERDRLPSHTLSPEEMWERRARELDDDMKAREDAPKKKSENDHAHARNFGRAPTHSHKTANKTTSIGTATSAVLSTTPSASSLAPSTTTSIFRPGTWEVFSLRRWEGRREGDFDDESEREHEDGRRGHDARHARHHIYFHGRDHRLVDGSHPHPPFHKKNIHKYHLRDARSSYPHGRRRHSRSHPHRRSRTHPHSQSATRQTRLPPSPHPGESRTVLVTLLARMFIAPLVLVPVLAGVKWAVDARGGGGRDELFDDPVFIVSNVLLISAPPALTLAQITQAASHDAFERLISRTIFWAYCIVTPPATLAFVVLGLVIAKG